MGSIDGALQVKTVTIQEVTADGMAACTDQFGAPLRISTRGLRYKGFSPERGDRWLIDKVYGTWTFSMYLGVPPVQPGHVMLWSTPTAPVGWLACDGTLALRADQPGLFATIGTDYNTGGEADTEFRLPPWGGSPPSTPLHVIKT